MRFNLQLFNFWLFFLFSMNFFNFFGNLLFLLFFLYKLSSYLNFLLNFFFIQFFFFNISLHKNFYNFLTLVDSLHNLQIILLCNSNIISISIHIVQMDCVFKNMELSLNELNQLLQGVNGICHLGSIFIIDFQSHELKALQINK